MTLAAEVAAPGLTVLSAAASLGAQTFDPSIFPEFTIVEGVAMYPTPGVADPAIVAAVPNYLLFDIGYLDIEFEAPITGVVSYRWEIGSGDFGDCMFADTGGVVLDGVALQVVDGCGSDGQNIPHSGGLGEPFALDYSGPITAGVHTIRFTCSNALDDLFPPLLVIERHSLRVDPDCNLNGVADQVDLMTGTSFDSNGNGIPDECEQIGEVYCVSPPNSTGMLGELFIGGSSSLSSNDMQLMARDLPSDPGNSGYFLVSFNQGFVDLVSAGISSGNLCLGSGKGRYLPGGPIQPNGTMVPQSVDLWAIPQSSAAPTFQVAAAVGDTLHFQAWHRDSLSTPSNNFTYAARVTVTP